MSVFKNKAGTRWVVQVYDASTRRMRQVGTYDTRKLAKAAEANAVRLKLTHGITIAEFAGRWLEEFPRGKPSSEATLRERLKPLVAEFGKRRMDSLTLPEARRWALEHRHCLPAPRAMWNDARRLGLVEQNPFAALGIEVSRGRRDLPSGWLTAEQVQALADTAPVVLGVEYGTTFRAMILFSAYVGLRPGEMYVLEWDCLGTDTVEVKHGADSRTRTVSTPKSDVGRIVVYPRIAREAVATIAPLGSTPLVFPSPRGKQFWASTFSRYWDKVKCAAGRPDMAFHEMRHHAATHLLELGLSPADVAVQLGHRDGGKLVMSTYGHPSEAAARARIRAAVDGYESGDLSSVRNRRAG